MVIVGIYKIPPLWNRLEKKKFIPSKSIDFVNIDNMIEFKEHSKRITNVKNNVYFEMFNNIANMLNVIQRHFIFIDETIEKNQTCVINSTNIWLIKSHDDLCYFMNADMYFFRGNYLSYYDNFTNNIQIPRIFFYAGTSIAYSYFDKKARKPIKVYSTFNLHDSIEKKIKNMTGHPFYKKIEVSFVHENPDYKNIYKDAKFIQIFNKPASNSFKYLNLEREYDFIFIGDAIQTTKNHRLMFDFINYCENNNINIKILYISDKKILKVKCSNYLDENELNFVTLKYDNYLTPENLNIYMNKSRIHLILAGRDAFPRTISETMYAGCYNVALDTLSDGKNMITGLTGEVVSESSPLMLMNSRSLCYLSCDNLWRKILLINNKKFDHEKISLESHRKFNYQCLESIKQPIENEIISVESSNDKEISLENEIISVESSNDKEISLENEIISVESSNDKEISLENEIIIKD
jgi:hypothetical protein